MRSVTAQGSPHARFRRALATRNATLAWAAATELPTLGLADALALCLLVTDDPKRYARAAVRWHVRFCSEVRGVTLPEAHLALAALEALPNPATAGSAAEALAHLCDRRGLQAVVAALNVWR